jgi:predicted GIY-YIG superfamily endonuclease
MTTIYILELEGGNYYVGKSENIDSRINDHFTGRGSIWTKAHTPIKVLEKRSETSIHDEENITLEMMYKYGIEKVRGGSYCKKSLSAADLSGIRTRLDSIYDLCYHCHKSGHITKACPKETKGKGKDDNKKLCSRCGRSSHTAVRCYAKTHANGETLPSRKKADTQAATATTLKDEAEPPKNASSSPKKITPAPKKRTPVARSQVGVVDQHVCSPSLPFASLEERRCTRCGRNSHTEEKCYAKTTIAGKVLSPKSKIVSSSNEVIATTPKEPSKEDNCIIA